MRQVAEVLGKALSVDLAENAAEVRRADAQLRGGSVEREGAVHIVLPHILLRGQQQGQDGKKVLRRTLPTGKFRA